MLQAQSLSKLPASATDSSRALGGVSEGVYESLNGGVGSEDSPAKVAENRARMAKHLGVAPDRFLTCYQIHSPEVVVAETPWPSSERPARRRDRDADAPSRHRCLDRRLRTGAAGRSRGAGDRCRACRVAGSADRRDRTNGRGDGKARRQARTDRGGGRTDDPSAQLRGRPGPDRSFRRGRPKYHPLLQAGAASPAIRCSISPGYVVSRLRRAEIAEIEDLGLCTYADPAQFYSYRRATHRAEPDYGRHINAIALAD
jgi:hypothetical protein